MNKRFLLVAALCAAMNLSGFAQVNLALNKPVVASTETANETAQKAVDGDLNTRWQVDATQKEKESVANEENDMTVTNGHWIYVDLQEEQDINTIRVRWEGAYAKAFKILVASELDETTQEPKWETKEVFAKDETLTDFSKYYTYFLSQTVKARYVKLQATELGYKGNWFSLFEFGVYNLTDKQKVPTITKMTTPKNLVAPGEVFSVNITDQFDNAMTEGITYDCTNATRQDDGTFKADAAGEVTVKATDKQGKSQEIKLTAYVPALTVAKVSPAVVITGVETPLTFTVKDQHQQDIVGYTTSVTDNKITADQEGEQEITVSYKGEEQKLKVYAVSEGKAAPTLGVDDMPIFMDGEEGLGIADKGWNGQYSKKEVIDLKGNKVWRITNTGTFGFNKGSISDTDYTTLHFDIYSTTDVENAFVKYEGAGAAYENLTFSLKAGQWNHVELNVEGANAYNSWIQINLGKADAPNNPDVLIDNVYLAKAAASQDVTFGDADEKGIVSVRGTVTADQLATLAERDGTAFDLTKATIAEGVNVSDIKFKNPNAVLIVPGEVDRTDNKNTLTYDAKWDNLTNAVLKSNDGYLFPIKQMQITDKNPLYRAFFVSTGSTGYQYTRPLTAKSYATVFLPAVATIPEGCEAFEFAADPENANNVVLKKVETLNAKVPYIIYNGNETETNLVAAGTGDMDFREVVAADQTTKVGNLNVIGTFDSFKGSDKTVDVYGIQNQSTDELTLRKVTDATVSPFRLYFTLVDGGNEQAAKAISFSFDGTATGIKQIDAADAAKAGNVYSIDGKLVKANATTTEGLAKGVYIINGKKYVVK